jgi:hypothetical protein
MSDVLDKNQVKIGEAPVQLDTRVRGADCTQPDNCDPTPLSKHDPENRRYKYDDWIVEAANEWGIDPALIKAQLHAETSIDPLKENEPEKEACLKKLPNCNRGYQWGKGLGQFGRDRARFYGLDWNAPKPSSKAALSAMCDKLPAPSEGGALQPVWCPRAAIWAKAKYLRERLDEEYYVPVEIKGRGPGFVRVDTLYKRNLTETARYLAGMFNRGKMPINSIEEHYRQTGSFPAWYGVAWSTPRVATTPKVVDGQRYQILNKENINRCHVFKIAGLCGDEPQGWIREYSQDFAKDARTGEWKKAAHV